MKKNILYTLCLLLSGTFLFSSCEDMLESDTTRVDTQFGNLTMNDSVYSVLGIIKSLQNIGDRQVLLGELRGDLVNVVEDNASLDIQEISKFNFSEDNQYLSIKDYYTVINNCNVFLSRVDTNLVSKNEKVMLGEFLAVTSIRAWTYLQLAINYDRVRYFTRPLLTHGDVQEEMSKAPISRQELLTHLIEELRPYEDPRVYAMPMWSGVKTGGNISVSTEKLFVPIRMLLGELLLWRGQAGDYTEAAGYYYKMLTDSPSFPGKTGNRYYYDTEASASFWFDSSKGLTIDVEDSYSALFEERGGVVSRDGSALTVIPFQNTTTTGSISNLSDIFFPEVPGMAQVVESAGYSSLSNRQVYYAYDPTGTNEAKYNPAGNNGGFMGDLRRYTVVGSTRNNDLKQIFSGNILKHCMPSMRIQSDNIYLYSPGLRTGYIQLYRDTHIFLRFAEALLGMERFEGYTFFTNYDKNGTATPVSGKLRFTSPAMDILKRGMDWQYVAVQNAAISPATEEEKLEGRYNIVVNEAGVEDTIMVRALGNVLEYDMVMRHEGNIVNVNEGIHARGTGNSEYNLYYALNDTCIARYNGELVELSDGVMEIPAYTREDSLTYVADILLDELALEFCFEGQRFGDLIRFAKAAEKAGDPNWKEILVKRVNGRNTNNTVSFRSPDFQTDGANIECNLNDETNWYLPIPGDILIDVLPGEDDDDVIVPGEDDDDVIVPGEDGDDVIVPGEDGDDVVVPGEDSDENTPSQE